ncbi:MAG: 3'(2'),5'-bisphosphate nucleotidase CysQ [Pseudomonadota bacterium]
MNLDGALEAKLVELVRAAGQAILEVYETDFDVENKADESPLTQADLASHKVIAAGLAQLTPDIPVVSEESAPPDYSVRSQWSEYWLVDPLDGTKEFVNRNGEFTANIALIRGNRAVAGFVGLPVQDKVYVGDVDRGIAYCLTGDQRAEISGRAMHLENAEVVVVASRSHGGDRLESYLDELSANFNAMSRKPVGSSLKLCALAAGEADCYPRLGPTSEWDIAAAHAVLTAAGGEVYTFDGQVLAYNAKESFLNPEFVAVADARFGWFDILPQL